MSVHSTAIVHPDTDIAHDVEVGPYTVIGPQVSVDSKCHIGAHVVIDSRCRIGKNNRIFQFASVGAPSQDLKYRGEESWLEVGSNNILREFCTINRGTGHDRSLTTIGSNNTLLAYTHIAHDCVLGDHIVMSNNASIAGHVYVDDYAVLGPFSAFHQFCRIGAHAMVGGGAWYTQDVPAFVTVASKAAPYPVGINTVGLRRRNFDQHTITALQQCFKVLYKKGLRQEEALQRVRALITDRTDAIISRFIDSILRSKRGIIR